MRKYCCSLFVALAFALGSMSFASAEPMPTGWNSATACDTVAYGYDLAPVAVSVAEGRTSQVATEATALITVKTSFVAVSGHFESQGVLVALPHTSERTAKYS
jgi:hypothetical protein